MKIEENILYGLRFKKTKDKWIKIIPKSDEILQLSDEELEKFKNSKFDNKKFKYVGIKKKICEAIPSLGRFVSKKSCKINTNTYEVHCVEVVSFSIASDYIDQDIQIAYKNSIAKKDFKSRRAISYIANNNGVKLKNN